MTYLDTGKVPVFLLYRWLVSSLAIWPGTTKKPLRREASGCALFSVSKIPKIKLNVRDVVFDVVFAIRHKSANPRGGVIEIVEGKYLCIDTDLEEFQEVRELAEPEWPDLVFAMYPCR